MPVRAQGHHRDRADQVERQVAEHEVHRVGQLQQHPLAGLQAQGEKRAAILAARQQFGIGQAFVAVHQRQLVRPALRAARQHPAHRHAFPQAQAAVAGGQFVWPGNKTFHACLLQVAGRISQARSFGVQCLVGGGQGGSRRWTSA
jgi:hypothetical protein